MSDSTTTDIHPAHPRINHDGRVFGTHGEPDYFVVGHFWPKLGFFIFSVVFLSVGLWELWAPLTRTLFGEIDEARVVRIVRQSPGEADELIRIRREIKEGDYPYDTIFRHFVEVQDAAGTLHSFELAVASRQRPYALVNERVRVAYFKGDSHAFGILQHRTWAFGCALVMMGATFVPLAWFLLRMVGQRIIIDPEDPAQLALEQEAEARDRTA
jgi:hypothetical protein